MPEERPMEHLPFTRPTLDAETILGVTEVLRSGWIASGPKVIEFEAALSRYFGGRPVRVLASATAALEIALLAAGIGPGDEVIVPAMTFAASANVVLRVGAYPVFVDVGLDTRNIDVDAVEAAVSPRTRAIMPVHFAGLAADVDRLYAIAKRHDLRVIEDAAHAIGTLSGGRRIGSFGDLVCFSFHANKNLTTIEGGAIVADNGGELLAIERQRFHGLQKLEPDVFEVTVAGGKANLSDVAARIGIGQLARLDEFNASRRRLAARYFERWTSDPVVRPPARGDEGHSWHMMAPLLELDRLALTRRQYMSAMDARGIGVGVHYLPLHLFELYRRLGYRAGQFPNAERIGRQTVTLPLFPTMSIADVDRVVDATDAILRQGSA
jgi:dTDP-4-amino-4,6-dideoxygalactose transaminase